MYLIDCKLQTANVNPQTKNLDTIATLSTFVPLHSALLSVRRSGNCCRLTDTLDTICNSNCATAPEWELEEKQELVSN